MGLIGCGAIGTDVARLLAAAEDIHVVAALVRDAELPRPVPACASLDELIALRPDVVVEAAGHAALAWHGPAVLRAGIDLVMVSVGALADASVEADIRESATHARAIIASGAIGGLDALAAAAVGGLDRVTHTTRKPAGSLMGAAEAAQLREPRELFRGCAREGALRFPESINVVAAVSLAGIGFDRTEVCVIADPSIDRNTHEVVASGAFGDLRFAIRNIPSEANPRTGRLVAMSIVHTLRRLSAPLVIG